VGKKMAEMVFQIRSGLRRELFYALKLHDQFVSHYTKATTAIEHILKSGRIRLSPFVETNDPREFKCWEFGFRTNGTFDREFDDLATARKASLHV
jgi:hypothetical protein